MGVVCATMGGQAVAASVTYAGVNLSALGRQRDPYAVRKAGLTVPRHLIDEKHHEDPLESVRSAHLEKMNLYGSRSSSPLGATVSSRDRARSRASVEHSTEEAELDDDHHRPDYDAKAITRTLRRRRSNSLGDLRSDSSVEQARNGFRRRHVASSTGSSRSLNSREGSSRSLNSDKPSTRSLLREDYSPLPSTRNPRLSDTVPIGRWEDRPEDASGRLSGASTPTRHRKLKEKPVLRPGELTAIAKRQDSKIDWSRRLASGLGSARLAGDLDFLRDKNKIR